MRSNPATVSIALMQEIEVLAKRLRASTVKVQRRRRGGGSGVVWHTSGLIVTNAHVVPGPQANVLFSDGRRLAGKVIARDVEHDIAAVRVEARNLPAVTCSDSDALDVGELLFAVGNPRSVVGGLRVGIVHALSHPAARSARHWIEADIDLPPGYSGGPLADAAGRVVGVNSMATNDGRGYAVPSKTVEAFLSSLKAKGAVSTRDDLRSAFAHRAAKNLR